jgi:subtilisin family serine protease
MASHDAPLDAPNIEPVGGWLRMRLAEVAPSDRLPVTVRFDPAVVCPAGVESQTKRTDPPPWADCTGSQRTRLRVGAAQIRSDKLRPLARQPGVVRLEFANRPGWMRPLRITGQSTGSVALRTRPNTGWTGRGVTIAMIDAGVDVLHPAFFHADAGAYRWIDADRDGRLTGGSGDGIDLDGDGDIDRNERLRVLQSADIIDFPDGTIANQNSTFEPSRDWLYIDQNENGRRDAGIPAGFGESTPGYGEPLFVADDIDGDGRIRRGEKLFRLGSSKIRRLQLGETTFRRGDNLIEAAQRLDDVAIHGTGTAGIMVAGQPRFHSRVGLAPDADLLVYRPDFDMDGRTTRHIAALQNALGESDTDPGGSRRPADIFVHQWVNPFTQPLSGQTNLDVALNRASESGMHQVVPVGNLHEARKHTSVSNPSRETSLAFRVPSSVDAETDRNVAVDRVFGGLQYDGELSEVRLRTPDNTSIVLPADGSVAERPLGDGTLRGQGAEDATGARSRFFAFDIETDATDGLPSGRWAFELTFSQAPDQLWGRISDPYSLWDVGVEWVTATQSSTIAHPAAADSAIGVGAHRGRRFDVSSMQPLLPAVRSLRGFSGRGPSFDGRRIVDIVAPDNPLTPLAAVSPSDERAWGSGWWVEFGGTSGAAPHVAGAMAQLLESTEPLNLPGALWEGATDAAGLTPRPEALPSPAWGHGGLEAVQAARRTSAPKSNRAPTLKAELARTTGDRLQMVIGGTSDPDSDPLTLRFDLDYDGRWDRTTTDLSPVTFARSATGGWIKLRVRDRWGAQDQLLLEVPGQPTHDATTRDSSGSPRPSPAPKPGGCGCRTAGPSERLPWWWLLGIVGLRLGCSRRTLRKSAANDHPS